MATDARLLEDVQNYLVQVAGGYLRNTIREPSVTCAVCATPTFGYRRCFQCNVQSQAWGNQLANAVGGMIYAVGGSQSGYVMRGYKANPPVAEHADIVTLLCFAGLTLHTRCVEKAVGAPVTHWTTVPSLPAKPGEHPLRARVGRAAPGFELRLTANSSVSNPREVNREHFRLPVRVPASSHVLLLDDTWARGGHAQSAVLALRAAGVRFVSVLVVARWINENFGENAKFVRERLTRDYDTRLCPWTGGDCP